MTIYILFGLLCVFSCNKEQNEKSDDVVNKQIESVSSVSNEETETSVLLDTNTLETFEPLSENEIFSYEKPSKENGFALKIDRVDLSTENKTYYKKYTNFLDYLFQTEDKKGLLFQVRNRGKFELHFLDGKNGTIKKIYEHQSPFDTRSSSKSDFIVIFNKDNK